MLRRTLSGEDCRINSGKFARHLWEPHGDQVEASIIGIAALSLSVPLSGTDENADKAF